HLPARILVLRVLLTLADEVGALVRDRLARYFLAAAELDLGDLALGLNAGLARIEIDRALLEAALGRLARAEVPLDRRLRARAVVALRHQLVATGADARIEVAAEQDLLVILVRVLEV